MKAAEVTAARERLGLTLDAFAAEMGFTPHVASAWESGTVAMPSRYEAELRWRLALQDRDDALKASGLAECAWIAHWQSQPFPMGLKPQTKHLESGVAHAKICPTCIARERFTAERFGELPRRPLPGGLSVLAWIAERVKGLPEWLRPVATATMLCVALTLLRILFEVPALIQSPRGWLVAAQTLVTGAAIGVVVGLVISFARFAARWIAR